MTITKIIERTQADGGFLRITAELREDHSLLSDGFSVTAELYEARGRQTGAYRARRGWDADVYGCQHSTVLEFAPELAPLVAVHLADPNGVPMHAAANGWYFYSGDASADDLRNYGAKYVERQGNDHERAARALNIAPAELPAGMNEALFMAFVESLRPRWAQMATDARALLESL